MKKLILALFAVLALSTPAQASDYPSCRTGYNIMTLEPSPTECLTPGGLLALEGAISGSEISAYDTDASAIAHLRAVCDPWFEDTQTEADDAEVMESVNCNGQGVLNAYSWY